MVRLQNADGVPPENSQRHSLEQEIALALILKSHCKSATQIFKKLEFGYYIIIILFIIVHEVLKMDLVKMSRFI